MIWGWCIYKLEVFYANQLSELRVRLAPWNQFKPSSKICLLTVPRRYYFCGSFGFLCRVFLMLLQLFIVALWSPAGKGLTSWLLLMMFIVFLLLSRVVSSVMCGTWMYRFLIFAVDLLRFLINEIYYFVIKFLPSESGLRWANQCPRDLLFFLIGRHISRPIPFFYCNTFLWYTSDTLLTLLHSLLSRERVHFELCNYYCVYIETLNKLTILLVEQWTLFYMWDKQFCLF